MQSDRNRSHSRNECCVMFVYVQGPQPRYVTLAVRSKSSTESSKSAILRSTGNPGNASKILDSYRTSNCVAGANILGAAMKSVLRCCYQVLKQLSGSSNNVQYSNVEQCRAV